MKLLQLHPIIKGGPKCFYNFYMHHMAIGVEFKDANVFNYLLAEEPCKVELIKTFASDYSVNGWGLRFETHEDCTAFMLRWS